MIRKLVCLLTYLLGGMGGMERHVLVWKLDADYNVDLVGLSNLTSAIVIHLNRWSTAEPKMPVQQTSMSCNSRIITRISHGKCEN